MHTNGLWACVRIDIHNLNTQSVLYLGLICMFPGLVYLFDDLPIRNFILFKFRKPKVLEFQLSEDILMLTRFSVQIIENVHMLVMLMYKGIISLRGRQARAKKCVKAVTYPLCYILVSI